MNWLSPSCVLLAALSLYMAHRLGRLESSVLLNRKLAAACVLCSLYELTVAGAVAAPSPESFWPFLDGAAVCYLILGPLVLAGLFDFAGFDREWRWVLLSPSLVLTSVQVYQVLTGTWVIAGFRSSSLGNVNVLTEDPFPIAVNQAGSLAAAALGLGAILFALLRSRSKRYRAIALSVSALSLGINLWGVFTTGIVWMRWHLPDPTCLGAGIVLVGYSMLVERYQDRSAKDPDLPATLLAGLRGFSLFADSRGRVAAASEGSVRLLGTEPAGLALAELLPGWPSLAEHWAGLASDLQPRTDLAGLVGGERYRLRLLPHRSPLGAFDGALVRIVPEGPLDGALSAAGIPALDQELVRLVCEGFSDAQIGDGLGLSPVAVKLRLRRLCAKAGVSGREELERALAAASRA